MTQTKSKERSTDVQSSDEQHITVDRVVEHDGAHFEEHSEHHQDASGTTERCAVKHVDQDGQVIEEESIITVDAEGRGERLVRSKVGTCREVFTKFEIEKGRV